MKDMMFSLMLNLSGNMWGDPNSRLRFSHWHETNDLDLDVWHRIIDAMPSFGFNAVLIDVGDGIQYDSHPEVSIPGAWSKEFMKKELDHMRSIGIKPYPKLNFSGGHDAWLKQYSHMLGTEKYRQVCADLIKEVHELFGSEYFHLGMDEEDPTNQRALQFQCVRRNEVFWKDVYHLFDTCRSLGTTPWIWSDMYWHRPKEFLERMPKDVLQCNWNYSALAGLPSKDHPELALESGKDSSVVNNPEDASIQERAFMDFEKAGFKQTLCCSNYSCFESSERSFEYARHFMDPEKLVGIFTAPWALTEKRSEARLFDAMQRFYKAKQKYYPELMK